VNDPRDMAEMLTYIAAHADDIYVGEAGAEVPLSGLAVAPAIERIAEWVRDGRIPVCVVRGGGRDLAYQT